VTLVPDLAPAPIDPSSGPVISRAPTETTAQKRKPPGRSVRATTPPTRKPPMPMARK